MRNLLPLAAVVAAVSPLAAQPVADVLNNLESGPIPVEERELPAMELSEDGSIQYVPFNVYDYFGVYSAPGPVVRITFGEALSDENSSVDVQLFAVGKENKPIEGENPDPNPPLNLNASGAITAFLDAVQSGKYQNTLIHLSGRADNFKLLGAGVWKPEPDDAYLLADYIEPRPWIIYATEKSASFPRNKGSLMFYNRGLSFGLNLTDNGSLLDLFGEFAWGASIGWVGNGLQAPTDEQLKPLLDLMQYETYQLNPFEESSQLANLLSVPLKDYTSGRAKQEHQLWIKDVSIVGGRIEERPQISVFQAEEGGSAEVAAFHKYLNVTIDEDGYLQISLREAGEGEDLTIYGDTDFFGYLVIQSSNSNPEVSTDNYFLRRIGVRVYSRLGNLLGFAEESSTAAEWYNTPIGWVWTDTPSSGDAAGAWVYHGEHGWIYVLRSPTREDVFQNGLYFYVSRGVIGSDEDFGWVWTRPGDYPTIYSYGFANREGATVTDGWLLYTPRAGKISEDRWFYQWSKAYYPFPEWPEEVRYGAYVRSNGEVVPESELNPKPDDSDDDEDEAEDGE